MKRLFVHLVSCLTMASCDLITGPTVETTNVGFWVRASSGRLILGNATGERVHYVALEAEESALVDLAPASLWPSFQPGTEVHIPYAELIGYEPGDRQAVVYWCLLARSNCGHLWIGL